MWRLCKLGYRHEPRLMVAAFVLSQLAALPDALLALWLMLLGKGVLEHRPGLVRGAAIGLGVSAAATWFLRTVSTRVQRRFRDKVTIALESHVARLQASIATIAHQERPEYLDRLSMLRNQVFVLDHMYMSLFSTLGWILRLGVTMALLASIHPALLLLAVFAIPTVLTSTWRPEVERAAQERGAQSQPAGASPVHHRDDRAAREGSARHRHRRAPDRRAPGGVGALVRTGGGRALGLGDVAHAGVGGLRLRVCRRGRVRVVRPRARRPARCCWCWPPARASRRTSARPSARSDSCAASGWTARGGWPGWRTTPPPSPRRAICRFPAVLRRGIRLDHVSFAYPGTSRVVLDDVSVTLPAGAVVAIVGENGAGKTTLVKLLAKMYEPSSGAILVDDTPLARVPAAEWRARLAGAFQDFFRFEFRAGHTVGLGDVPRLDDEPAVVAAVDRAGAGDVVARLASGLDTQLGPTWPRGVELSFGQWQKLALARGFMRDEPLLLVLDEPTAALDAETEHALFERYAAAARGTGRAAAASRSWSRTASRRSAWPI